MALIPTRVGIVKEVGFSLLIRGSEPLNDDNSFAYNEIMAVLKRNLMAFQFVDVCLIDNTGERDMWAPEMSAFRTESGRPLDPNTFPKSCWPPYLNKPNWNPAKVYGVKLVEKGQDAPGSWVWWPIEGLSEVDDPKTFITTPGWDLNGLVDYLQKLLTGTTPRAVYVHCALGHDRTGAAITGYLMKWGKLPLVDALAESVASIADKKMPNADYMRLLNAYDQWLRPQG